MDPAAGLTDGALPGALVALGTTAGLVPLTSALARRLDIIDEPGARSSHVIRTPRLAGLAVLVGSALGLFVALRISGDELHEASPAAWTGAVCVGVSAAVIGAIGLFDDLSRGSPVWLRLAGQVVGAFVVVAWWVAENSSTAPLVAGVVAGIWVVGFVNAYNFMDGVNGNAAFLAIVAGVNATGVGLLEDQAALTVVGAVVVGATLGFLPFNVPRARAFLGDVGSYALGAWLATVVVVASVLGLPPESVGAVWAIYLVDTGLTLILRIRRGDDWRVSHHEHCYQRLIELGWSHLEVASLVATASAACAVLGLASLTDAVGLRVLADVAIVAVALAYTRVPHLVERRRTMMTVDLTEPARHLPRPTAATTHRRSATTRTPVHRGRMSPRP